MIILIGGKQEEKIILSAISGSVLTPLTLGVVWPVYQANEIREPELPAHGNPVSYDNLMILNLIILRFFF